MNRPLYKQVSDKLEELMRVIYKASPRQRAALQKKLRSLTETNCWWAMFGLRPFLRSYCDVLITSSKRGPAKETTAKNE